MGASRAAVLVLVVSVVVASADARAWAATIGVPADQPTVQDAIDAAGPGDTIVIEPGTYQESLLIAGDKDGLTIEAADDAHPPEIHGFHGISADGIRVDRVDGLTLRNLRIVGAYDGVRLLQVTGASLIGLHIEDNALGVRVNRGRNNSIIGSAVVGFAGDRGVEQAILVDHSPGTQLVDDTITGAKREGIRVLGAPCVRIERTIVSDSRGSDGIGIYSSNGVSVIASQSNGNARHGVFVSNSSSLTLEDDSASDNSSVGLRIVKSPPFATVADVVGEGNSASGNGGGDIFVQAQSSQADDVSPCEPTVPTPTPLPPTSTPRASATPARATSTARPSSTPVPAATATSGRAPTATLTPMPKTTGTLTPKPTSTPVPTATAAPGPTSDAQWRLYVQIAVTSGSTGNVNVPLRATDAPLTIAISADQIALFGKNVHKSEAQIITFGGDTLARLRAGVDSYLRGHPDDYPTYAGAVQLNWASRVAP